METTSHTRPTVPAFGAGSSLTDSVSPELDVASRLVAWQEDHMGRRPKQEPVFRLILDREQVVVTDTNHHRLLVATLPPADRVVRVLSCAQPGLPRFGGH